MHYIPSILKLYNKEQIFKQVTIYWNIFNIRLTLLMRKIDTDVFFLTKHSIDLQLLNKSTPWLSNLDTYVTLDRSHKGQFFSKLRFIHNLKAE